MKDRLIKNVAKWLKVYTSMILLYHYVRNISSLKYHIKTQKKKNVKMLKNKVILCENHAHLFLIFH